MKTTKFFYKILIKNIYFIKHAFEIRIIVEIFNIEFSNVKAIIIAAFSINVSISYTISLKSCKDVAMKIKIETNYNNSILN